MKIDNKKHRCGWCGQDPLYQQYHDQEWGVPVYDDQRLFEFLILETMQAGLSWITILKKRENYREALDHFDAVKIAEYDDEKHQELLSNPGIIRNKLKIKSITTNAQIFLDLQQRHGSFSKFIWSYVDHKPITNHWKTYKDIPPNTPLSDQLSKDLKKMGFKFVGSTIVYAFMQATGMVNDHEINCYRYDEV
ncbi:DNA-3-methyladenine glycosylase [Nonlabens sp. YIK11]|uniref:DNA-3-methyladenine glycosylase I n=1 Tax=Nonlabens sp. YIK11 TaxID=1453349 RepID=UPI0006DC81AF|nr:DNA-3-methyladenine glycosylase I [Nonlabens sp. YIK11]KQC32519.1 DNA-3-methyladenine glycosylase [Nonlabens sp. YIK11]